ncbi:MAG: hydroxymethylpyrimidine/phosphomethylpyrimidine kinase, partial [Candidatus Aureabacteria bacterium]|nr:hydroxymethylpyrimidine/phosphomethylpyrimidine kinase [Candidatus Auribacterota bacterium]
MMSLGRGATAVLTIAGSDPTCGAGLQADLKTFQSYGVYGLCAVTAVTVQDGARVSGIAPIAPALVAAQIDAALSVARVRAVKTGMLWSGGVVRAVRRMILKHRLRNLVVDPVLASHEGERLSGNDLRDVLVRCLFPLARLVTPNIPEAGRLAGITIEETADIFKAARLIHAMGPGAVLIKGGHGRGPAVDWYYDGRRFSPFIARRQQGRL